MRNCFYGRYSGPYFVFGIERRDVTVGHAGYARYIATHTQTWWCIVALVMSIVFGLHAKLIFFACATCWRRNGKCVTRLFQWTTLLCEMYMRKTVKVGNSVHRIRVYRTNVRVFIAPILFEDLKIVYPKPNIYSRIFTEIIIRARMSPDVLVKLEINSSDERE